MWLVLIARISSIKLSYFCPDEIQGWLPAITRRSLKVQTEGGDKQPYRANALVDETTDDRLKTMLNDEEEFVSRIPWAIEGY